MLMGNSIILVLGIPAFLVHLSCQSCNQYNIKVVETFDFAKFEGKWYESGRFETEMREVSDCTIGEHKVENDKIVGVISMKNHISNKIFELHTEIWRENPGSKKGDLKVHFRETDLTMDFWIFGNDYDNYNLVWGCDGNAEQIWVLTRNAEMTDGVRKSINKILTDAGIDPSKIKATNNNPAFCEQVWVFTRNAEMTDGVRKSINKILTDAGIDISKIRATNNNPAFCGW